MFWIGSAVLAELTRVRVRDTGHAACDMCRQGPRLGGWTMNWRN